MTTTVVSASQSSASEGRGSATSSSTKLCQFQVTARLAPHIYLGHVHNLREDTRSTGPSPSRTVVIKCAGKLLRDDVSGQLQGPWKELQGARQLCRVAQTHPNVVQIVATFVQRSLVFVVMEYCARGDLLADLAATQPESRLNESHALHIVFHLTRGLQFLHETCNIAHRDVSLENVFVTHDGTYKLGDFGLSTCANRLASGCVGKSQYVAPEVVAETSYDPVTADIWSLGIVLFMLLTGAPLMEIASPASSEFNRIKALGCCNVLRLWKTHSQFSDATLDLLSKMLEIDPLKRVPTTSELLTHPTLVAASHRAENREGDKF